MRRKIRAQMSLFAFIFVWGQASPVFSSEMNLVPLLMESLGVTKNQAAGGAGAIFNTAKSKLPAEDFSKVEAAVPNMNELLQVAPKETESGGMIQSGRSLLGGGTESLQGMTGLANSFSQLGLSPDMVNQFMPIILDFVQKVAAKRYETSFKGPYCNNNDYLTVQLPRLV